MAMTLLNPPDPDPLAHFEKADLQRFLDLCSSLQDIGLAYEEVWKTPAVNEGEARRVLALAMKTCPGQDDRLKDLMDLMGMTDAELVFQHSQVLSDDSTNPGIRLKAVEMGHKLRGRGELLSGKSQDSGEKALEFGNRLVDLLAGKDTPVDAQVIETRALGEGDDDASES